jgi:phosphopantothenoylcysteine decarboxylase/phosphopantothenate--cysteine ligase
MTQPFKDKKILLGVSGSIAAYKTVDLASKLTQAGALVTVLMTESAKNFITPLTFRSITHSPVLANLFDQNSPTAVNHITLAKEADAIVIAPATANTLAKLAWGFADDPVSVTWLAADAPRLVAPAMDADMWNKQQVFDNIEALRAQGTVICGPAKGHLASGLEGWGRMSEVHEIMARLAIMLGRTGDLAERRLIVSAGGTQEPIDPVRVIANRSSGKMGYAIAEAARNRGAQVILVTGPTSLPDLIGVKTFKVETAEEMREEIMEAAVEADGIIMAAAVADFRPLHPVSQKLKKAGKTSLTLELTNTKDILGQTPKELVRVGFAAETNDILKNAEIKLKEKGLDLIVINDVTEEGSGFGSDTNKVTLLHPDGKQEHLPIMDKHLVAWELLDRVRELLIARD